jgi:ABC-type lipoprotein release transport system permease subunit
LIAAAIGMGIAALLFPGLEDVIGLSRLSWRVVAAGLLLALVLALVSAFLPGWKMQRLRIVEALRVF